MTAQLEQVSKQFLVGDETVRAVNEVDFALAEGEMVCVYGASGSGKTTLLSIMAGIDLADSGRVTVAGQLLSGRSERDRADVRLNHIGVVFQSNNLLPEFTTVENVALPLMVRGLKRAEATTAAIASLASVGLEGLANRLPIHMSGGQRQRVGIARALAGEQKVLLADEPTGALDSENSRLLFELLRSLCDTRGTSVVLATHDPIAREYSDSIYHMVDGNIEVK